MEILREQQQRGTHDLSLVSEAENLYQMVMDPWGNKERCLCENHHPWRLACMEHDLS